MNCFLFVFKCHRIHRTLTDQFKYALVWVCVSDVLASYLLDYSKMTIDIRL